MEFVDPSSDIEALVASGELEVVETEMVSGGAQAQEVVVASSAGVPGTAIPEAPRQQRRPWRRVITTGLCALVLAGCTSHSTSEGSPQAGIEASGPLRGLPEFDASHEQNVLSANWQFAQGVTVVDGGLRVAHTGEATLTTPPENEDCQAAVYA